MILHEYRSPYSRQILHCDMPPVWGDSILVFIPQLQPFISSSKISLSLTTWAENWSSLLHQILGTFLFYVYHHSVAKTSQKRLKLNSLTPLPRLNILALWSMSSLKSHLCLISLVLRWFDLFMTQLASQCYGVDHARRHSQRNKIPGHRMLMYRLTYICEKGNHGWY